MKKKYYWIGGLGIILCLIASIMIIRIHTKPKLRPGASISPKEKKNTHSSIAVKKKSLPFASLTNRSAADEYPYELEDEFIKEAMETMPFLIEVEVHEPGVIFFRQRPVKPEVLKEDMKKLAELYRDLLGYDKPVNVVFFISGRPVMAQVFFRD